MLSLREPESTVTTIAASAMSTSAKQTWISLATLLDAQSAKLIAQYGHPLGRRTAECRKRLQDARTANASTAARVNATRLRRAERFFKDLDSWNFVEKNWRQVKPGPGHRQASQRAGGSARRAREPQRLMLHVWRQSAWSLTSVSSEAQS